jgi:hypothetical protein
MAYSLFAGYGRVQTWELKHCLQEAKQVMGTPLDVPRTSRMFMTAIRKARYLCLKVYKDILLTTAWSI